MYVILFVRLYFYPKFGKIWQSGCVRGACDLRRRLIETAQMQRVAQGLQQWTCQYKRLGIILALVLTAYDYDSSVRVSRNLA
jgi:hypothetical protein